MSYVVTIRRSNASPITPDELRDAVRADASFREAAVAPGIVLEPSVRDIEWYPGESERPVGFSLYAGEVAVTTPSNATLRKMQELALALGARVVGEGGEDFTSVEAPAFEVGGFGRGGVVVILLVGALALYWLLAG